MPQEMVVFAMIIGNFNTQQSKCYFLEVPLTKYIMNVRVVYRNVKVNQYQRVRFLLIANSPLEFLTNPVWR